MIFGNSGSKFVPSGSATTVLLERSVITPTWIDANYVEHKSVMNGKKNFITFGDYSEFNVLVHLHKYSNPQTKFNEIYAYNHTDVYFYPHLDGKPVMENSSTTASFHITEMKLAHLDSFNVYDVLNINFKSKVYTNISGSIL